MLLLMYSDRCVFHRDAILDEAVEWLYDLVVRKIKRCRIQPVGSRRQTRASSTRAADKSGRLNSNAAYRSQHTSNHPRNETHHSVSSEQSSGSSRGWKDPSRRRENWYKAHTEAFHSETAGVGRGSRVDLARGATRRSPGWAGQRSKHTGVDDMRPLSAAAHVDESISRATMDIMKFPDGQKSPLGSLNKNSGAVYGDVEGEPPGRSTHTDSGSYSIPGVSNKSVSPGVAFGRGVHIAQPLSLKSPRYITSPSNVGSVRGSLRSPDGQNTCRGAASDGQQDAGCPRPVSVDSGQVDGDLTSTQEDPSLTTSTSQQSDANPMRDFPKFTAAPESNVSGGIEQHEYTRTESDTVRCVPSPISLPLGNADSTLADEYNALNQTDSDVIIEESGSEDDEEWT